MDQLMLVQKILEEEGLSLKEATPEQLYDYSIAAGLIISGMMQMDDPSKPREYWGSVEHQVDLVKRLGLNFKVGQDLTDQEALEISNKMKTAQLKGKDANGELLFRSDFWVLAYFTGWTA